MKTTISISLREALTLQSADLQGNQAPGVEVSITRGSAGYRIVWRSLPTLSSCTHTGGLVRQHLASQLKQEKCDKLERPWGSGNIGLK